jgi:hypothetical protein
LTAFDANTTIETKPFRSSRYNDGMNQKADIAEWRMTEEAIPEHPDDPEWRRSVAIRLAYLAAVVASLGIGFVNVKLASFLGGALLALAASFHFYCWLKSLGNE